MRRALPGLMFALLAILVYFLRTGSRCDHVGSWSLWWPSHGGFKRTRFCSRCGATQTARR